LLDNSISLLVDPPLLYVDLKVIRLGRLGLVSLVLLYIALELMTYNIDIHILGGDAFSTRNSTRSSLESILENPKIPKVFLISATTGTRYIVSTRSASTASLTSRVWSSQRGIPRRNLWPGWLDMLSYELNWQRNNRINGCNCRGIAVMCVQCVFCTDDKVK
jgi:hypothetical protein